MKGRKSSGKRGEIFCSMYGRVHSSIIYTFQSQPFSTKGILIFMPIRRLSDIMILYKKNQVPFRVHYTLILIGKWYNRWFWVCFKAMLFIFKIFQLEIYILETLKAFSLFSQLQMLLELFLHGWKGISLKNVSFLLTQNILLYWIFVCKSMTYGRMYWD